MGHIQNWHHFFLLKNIQVFQWVSKLKFLIFMTKVNSSNGNETKSGIFFMEHIQIWHHICFYQKKLKCFNDFQNWNLSVLWLNWTETMEMKLNETFFYGTYSNLTSFFNGRKILKNLNNFYNWHFSISLQKWAKTSKVK